MKGAGAGKRREGDECKEGDFKRWGEGGIGEKERGRKEGKGSLRGGGKEGNRGER